MATSAQKKVISTTKSAMNDYKNKTNSSLNSYNAALKAYKNAINKTYKPSSQVTKYQNERDNALKKAQAMGNFSYKNQYTDKIEGLLSDAENMKFNFNYSLTDDPTYQSYRDQYVHNGKMAAQNAAAESVAQTGGYGSTASSTAAQQAYNESLTQLNSIVPDLYNAAYQRQWNEFSDNRDTLQELASAYQSLDQQGYEQALSTWTNNFNQYISLAQEYNSSYQYLDSAERQQYENKLDGLYNVLTSTQQQYSTNLGAYIDSMGNWSDAVMDSANYDLNAAQLAETKRHNQATEAAARAASSSSNSGGSSSAKANGKNVNAFKASIRTNSEFYGRRGTSDYKNYGGNYNNYVSGIMEQWLNSGKLTKADVSYLIDYYNL